METWTSLQLCVLAEAVLSGGQPGQQGPEQQQAEQQEQGQGQQGPEQQQAGQEQEGGAAPAATAQADAAVAQKGGVQAVVDRVAVWVASCEQQVSASSASSGRVAGSDTAAC